MSIGRRGCSVFLGLLAVALVPVSSAHAQQGAAPEIVVNAEVRKQEPPKLSGWKRAEADHVVVFSDGDQAELVRVTGNLERLHALMSRLYGAAGEAQGAPKLQVMLFDSREELEKLHLRNLRSEEGPFAGGFADQRYYDPRAGGDVVAIARSDQIIKLDTKIARDRFCDDLAAEQGDDCTGKTGTYPPPVVRPWQAVLYSAFAQHFILSNAPAAYPRWYLDGIGALFSTIEVRRNGALDYAQPPELYGQIFRAYGDVNVRAVLTGSYIDAPSRGMDWTPYHAWLVTHFFVFSNPKPELRAQFAQYMAAIARGASQAEAAKVFDMTTLNREIGAYVSRTKDYAIAAPPGAPLPDPSVTLLSPAQAAVAEARIGFGDPSAASFGDGGGSAQWIDRVRGEAMRQPIDADAMLVAAEAECRAARTDECLADAERVLAQSPQSAPALVWKGVALTDRAVAGPADERAGALAVARRTLESALQLDPRDPDAAIAYFQSFTRAGEPAPGSAMASLAKVAASAPAAPGPRLLMGEELVRQGKGDLAQRLLKPVLYGAYDSPEKKAAQALFALSGNAAQAGE